MNDGGEAHTPLLDYETRPLRRKRNTAAAIALLFGIMLFIPLVPGILAIIYGRRGVRLARDEALGRERMARTAIRLGLLNLAITLALMIVAPFWVLEQRERAMEVRCASNLRTIGQALLLYANDNRGNLPPRLDLLVSCGYMRGRVDFFKCQVCTRDGTTRAALGPPIVADYEYPAPAVWYPPEQWKYLGSTTHEMVIAWESPTNHRGRGMNVLFRDGRVRWFEGATAMKIDAELRVGENPPPTLDPHEAAKFRRWRSMRATRPSQ